MTRVARWLAVVRLPREMREFVLGDLEEEFAARVTAHGRRAATRWYWRAAWRSFAGAGPLDRGAQAGAPSFPGGQMQAVMRDVVVAVRRMRSRPWVSAAAVLTLALGLGANVAMFAVAWPVLAAPLPFPDEDRLTVVSLTYQRDGVTARNQVSVGDYNDWRTAHAFASLAAYSRYLQQMNLTGRGEPEPLTVGAVTAEFFSTLGVRPVTGRLLQASDARSAARVLVLSERTWHRRFAADPGVVGTTVRLDGAAYEIIGVAPSAAALGTIDPEAWSQLGLDPANRRRGAYFLGVIGRLKADVPLTAANLELAGIMERAAVEFPQFNRILSAQAEPFRDLSAASVRSTLVLLVISAALVLVVAVVNLVGLQLARAVERSRELAVRRALGASAWQVARHLLVENIVLAVIGGAVGVVVAWVTLDALEWVAPTFGWAHLAPAPRVTVVGGGMLLTCVTGVCLGLVPAWRAAASTDSSGLQVRQATAGRRGVQARMGIVALQAAATVVLLVGATLVWRSQRAALAVDTGFDFSHSVAADVNVPPGRYDTLAALTGFFDRLADRVRQVPGVAGVCLTNEVPLDRGPGSMTFVPEGEARLRSAMPTTISAGCPDLLRVPLVHGRWFTNAEPSPSVVVSAAMARLLWPDGRDPVGRRVHFGLPSGDLLTVVGVSADVRVGALESGPSPVVWMPQGLGYFTPRRLLVRYSSAGLSDPIALRLALRDADPDLALANLRSLEDIVSRATAPRRFSLFLLAGFALVATVLCAVGIYGVLAHVVGHRTQEIGIRVALGARPAAVARLVLLQVAVAVTTGIVAGLWSASALSSAVNALLFSVTARDAVAYLLAAAGVVAMAGLAAWMPTRRALRIAPVVALRSLE